MPHAAIAVSLSLALLASPARAAGEAPATLAFDRLFASGPAGARVAPEVEALAGHRVRIVGHMVRMELAPRAAFYLASRPVEADESGAGTADLPPHVVRVEVPGHDEVPWIKGPLEVEGRLEVGRAEDSEGRVSWLRVVVIAPAVSSPAGKVPSRSRDGVSKPDNAPGGRQ